MTLSDPAADDTRQADYGADISVLGSSVNHEFAADLVRTWPSSHGTTPLSWRALDEPLR
jgi:hypothetical protein